MQKLMSIWPTPCVPNRPFRLFRGSRELRLEPLSEFRWKVVSASPETGFQAGDEVAPVRRLSWEQAKRRVNSDRSALSPSSLILLRGGPGLDLPEDEITELLKYRPEPEGLPPAA